MRATRPSRVGTTEAARILGCCTETVRQMAKKGLIPGCQLRKGGNWTFERVALGNTVHRHTTRHPDDPAVQARKERREALRDWLEVCPLDFEEEETPTP